MAKDFYQDEATKKQSNGFKWGALTIFITAAIILLEWTFLVPVLFWWVTGAIGALVSAKYWVQYFKHSGKGFSNRHNDGGSSVR